MDDTGYISMYGKIFTKGPNYIRTLDGKFCIIDTESRFDHRLPIKGFLRILKSHNLIKELSDQAVELIFENLKRLMLQNPSLINWTLREIRSHLKKQS